MRVGRASTAAIAAVAVAGIIGAVALAHAGFEDDYAAGWKALNANNLDAAQRYFEQALNAQASSSSEVRLDGTSQPYLPQHYLGVIALRRGNCATAADYWNNPNNKRAISRLASVHQQETQSLASCTTAPVAAVAAKVAEAATETSPATSSSAALPAAKPAPPDTLKQALQFYIGGNYASAARIDPATMTEPRAKFHAYLIRAAARFMAVNTGGDAALLDGARSDVRAAHALDAHTQPDAATFAPRFRAFFSDTR